MGFIGYSLSQLAEETGVEMRTIRHYISIGILPPPSSRGRGARYDQVHLDRLKAIRVLQRDHKLDEIREILSSISPEELQQHISDWILEKPKNDLSARDYLNSVENQFRNSKREYRNLQTKRKVKRMIELKKRGRTSPGHARVGQAALRPRAPKFRSRKNLNKH